MRSDTRSDTSLWYPFTYFEDAASQPPIVVDRGSGLYLYDKTGKSYLDAIGSWWVSVLGHNHPEITAAVKEQLERLEHVIMAGFITEPALRLPELLGRLLPPGLTRVFYSDDGSTAVEAALKMALQYWALKGENRTRFVAFSGAYHGDTLGAMSVGAIPAYHSLFHERFGAHLFTDPPYCYRCPVGKNPATCNAECMDSLEAILEREGERVAACIFEPMVQGAAGMRMYPAKVLERLFTLCRRYEVLTIADEVAMGFGRTGTMFACDNAGVVPDIMCLAKGLTGGYLPLAATVVKEAIFDEFCGSFPSERIFHHGHSFTGNPLAASAACAALTIFIRDALPRSIHDTMAYFRQQLSRFDTLEIAGDIRSIGMVGAVELVADRTTKRPLAPERRIPYRIARRAVEKGLLIRPLGDVLYFIPAFIITREQIDWMFETTINTIGEVLDEEAGGS
jgi:adenosylmethionine-8-amino-7-oxononanoate aminotransferase